MSTREHVKAGKWQVGPLENLKPGGDGFLKMTSTNFIWKSGDQAWKTV